MYTIWRLTSTTPTDIISINSFLSWRGWETDEPNVQPRDMNNNIHVMINWASTSSTEKTKLLLQRKDSLFTFWCSFTKYTSLAVIFKAKETSHVTDHVTCTTYIHKCTSIKNKAKKCIAIAATNICSAYFFKLSHR